MLSNCDASATFIIAQVRTGGSGEVIRSALSLRREGKRDIEKKQKKIQGEEEREREREREWREEKESERQRGIEKAGERKALLAGDGGG